MKHILRRASLMAVMAVMAASHGKCYAREMIREGEISKASQAISTSSLEARPTPRPHEPKNMHGLPILQTDLTFNERAYWETYSTTTFFNLPEKSPKYQKRIATLHVWLIGLVSCIGYPIALVLGHVGWKETPPSLRTISDDSDSDFEKTSQRRWLKFCHTVLTTMNVFALLSATAVLSGFSDPAVQYPKNAYRRTSIIVAVVSVVHLLATIVRFVAFVKSTGNGSMSHYRRILQDYEMALFNTEDLSQTQSSSASHHTSIRDNSASRPESPLTPARYTQIDFNIQLEQDSLEARPTFSVPLSTPRVHYVFQFASNVLNCTSWPLFIVLSINCVIGIAVGCLFGQGKRVFNLLAHWIKGGVFIVLGVLSLARYCGVGLEKGWAWNKTTAQMHPTSALQNSKRMILPNGSMITIESIESFLIFFYGSTKVFLEHLSSVDGKWHPRDLQHVSIAFMFIGCGLCGLIVEHKLSDWRKNHSVKQNADIRTTGTPGYSPNPFPAFTIFWTGILMSQHEQASVTSTKIHVQWGSLLAYGSFFRLVTIFLLLGKPNKDNKPSKPFTELITSFCLLCGGMIFMESTDQVVEALEYRGLTSMFTLNLSVGFTTLFMAWEMLLLMWKDWLETH